MDPILEHVICGGGGGYVLVSEDSSDNIMDSIGETPMPPQDECARYRNKNTANANSTVSLDDESSDEVFDENMTILRKAPLFVEDRRHHSFQKHNNSSTGNGNGMITVIKWTSWTAYFHILHYGRSMIDMAVAGSGGGDIMSALSSSRQQESSATNTFAATTTTIITDIHETDEGGIQIHFGSAAASELVIEEENNSSAMNNATSSTVTMERATMETLVQDILKLTLQVNVMEGTMDQAIQRRLPGARYSLPGNEIETFSFSTLDDENIEQIETSQQPATSSSVTEDFNAEAAAMPTTMSMVAMSMYTSNTMRNCGIGLLFTTLVILASLLYAAKRRQCHERERELTQASANSGHIMREEDLVPDAVILNYGRKVKRRSTKRSRHCMASVALLSMMATLPYGACGDGKGPSSPPNFVIVLTDDLDWTLGGANASTLTRTRKYIAEQGKTFSNWFVQTPVCCPSRAELLTGKLYHNLKLTNSTTPGCMHINVTSDVSHPFYSRDYFAPYFSKNKNLQYKVGVFGKHLNNNNPTDFMLPGVDEMLINGGGIYMNPKFTYGSGTDESVQNIHFNTCAKLTGMPCYSTSIIGNASLSWIERHVKGPHKRQPFMSLISVKAPHLLDSNGYSLSEPAPWYRNTSISEQAAPRTPNYNYSGSPDHHWLVRSQGPITQEEGQHIDALYVSRLKTLISVDDLVEELVLKLDRWGVLNNTYVVFTSDNGYRLGQFRMPICKLHPYENDIRVPMMIRGPGIEKNSTSSLMSTHVNLMPTLMGLATGQYRSREVIPETMDGMNLAAGVLDHESNQKEEKITDDHESISQAASVLVQYASLGNVVRYNHLVDTYNHSFACLRILDTDPAHYPLHNIKYVEFRDMRTDWNMTGRPLEQEMYDLDQDPFELHNIIRNVPSVLVEALSEKIQRMLRCKGAMCREEHTTGLETYWSRREGKPSLS
ncbi:MAG: hypothetical protein SGILL_004805 [Bacillariaceae sp.]